MDPSPHRAIASANAILRQATDPRANPTGRYAIGDRDSLKLNPDGSLDLYIQDEDPGADRESNWLPAGGGPFDLTIRLYWPEEAILNGSWPPPHAQRPP